MAHREGIREYLKDVRPKGVVIDWGCGTKPMRNYLPIDGTFIGIDKLKHVNADIVHDLETPIELFAKADYAFCIEVLEHVWNSRALLKNIFDNLRPSGILYLSQPFFYEVHKEDDCIRYTYHGLRKLLEEVGFIVEDIQPTVGDLDHAEGYVLRARK